MRPIAHSQIQQLSLEVLKPLNLAKYYPISQTNFLNKEADLKLHIGMVTDEMADETHKFNLNLNATLVFSANSSTQIIEA